MKRSEAALEAGWTPICEGRAAACEFFVNEPNGRRSAFQVVAGDREVGVYVSPTGRSVRVFVDGAEVKP